MSSFQPPIPKDNYCRRCGHSYTGYTCPDCAAELEKERNNRICPGCRQRRVVGIKYMYCNNPGCKIFFIMFLK
jgi:hypothetical protein